MSELIENLVSDQDNTFSSRMAKECNINPLLLEDYYNIFFQDSPDAIFLINKERKIVWFNAVAEQLIAMEDDSFKCWENGFVSIVKDLINDSWENQREHYHREESLILGGKYLTFLWDSRLIRENHQLKGIILIAKDITQNKLLHEEQIHANMHKIIDQVASGLAHEIRNPLTAVRGFIQLLHESLRVSSKREYLQVALDELDRANNFIKDFLLFARPAAPNFSLVPLEQVILEATSQVEAQASLKNIHFEFMVPENFPLMYLDQEQMTRAFSNILQNAVDFSEQGNIKIRVINNEKTDKILVNIEDIGCGIPNENLTRVFEPFFSTKEEAPGLGLTLAQTIINNHGGKISICNNPDKGVSVTVHLLHVSKYPDIMGC